MTNETTRPKTGGRQKGAKNRATIAREEGLKEFADQKGYDPLKALIELREKFAAKNDPLSLGQALDIDVILLPYFHAKKATDIKGPEGSHRVVIDFN